MFSQEKLEVIGAGCGRTGTASLKRALEILGYPSYHMFEVKKNGHERLWEQALNYPESADWPAIFAGFRATVDFPASVAYTELMAAYPDAKVILSVRDAEGWARSVRDTIWNPYAGELSWVLAPFIPSFQSMTKAFRKRFFEDHDGGVSSGAIFDNDRLAARFDLWNARVKATVPKEKLLVFRAADGWAPLCEFLGVPVPEEPYPRVNDTAEFKQRISEGWRRAALIETGVVVLLAAGGFALASALRRSK
tara:strand:- start:822 stop:1571 length:750 start_codon:yes stop_codon:yes gene_type:complete